MAWRMCGRSVSFLVASGMVVAPSPWHQGWSLTALWLSLWCQGWCLAFPAPSCSIRAADDPLWQSCALWHQGWCQPPWRGFIHFCSTRPLCDISCLLQDLPNAMNAAEITDKLGLHSLRHRNWYIQATCATSGDGLYEGLDWLANQLKNKK